MPEVRRRTRESRLIPLSIPPLANAPDPQAAEQRLQQLLATPGTEAILRRLPREQLPPLLRLLSLSAFLGNFLCRHPEELAQCGREPGATTPETRNVEHPDAMLRRHKYRELLKICFLDVAGKRSCEVVLTDFSRLAEGIIGRTLEQACELPPRAWEKQGVPCVLALGKLGASELNLSSDVDLVYVAPERGLSEEQSQAYLHRASTWCTRLNNILQKRDVQGFLYRVDLRLRPWGTQGPLLFTVDAAENYYSMKCKPWERLAWLRARSISGSSQTGQDLLRRMEPFLYLRSLDQEAIKGLMGIKREFSKKHKKPGCWNVKTGVGGIREVEFFIHTLQLLHGAKQAKLRTTSTLEALSGLVQAGLLNDREARSLSHAYLFLRRLENLLQLAEEQQTHDLPENVQRRTVLARALFPEAAPQAALEKFEDQLDCSKALATSYFSRVLPGS